ncbi:ribonuclease E/G [Jannaschia sp. W003]|uniref:ribonuclease E/G n=1 Tax=Jannaschia sp. W003 TaxID=2867012 RepID=UPI0021A63CDB|nr:ribonuclease E/G [Jannaschia sp. W003]UWQ20377.1 ribonuclease E/G [Jannaschia sp. W003]
MKGTQVVLGRIGDRAAAALLRDGRLDDLLVDGPEGEPAPGAIFRGICDRPVKGQGGMFVRLGGGLTGFLRGAKGRRPGEPMLVQVSGHAEPGKAVPVTDRVLLRSRFCIVTPGAPGLNVARSIADEEERDRLLEAAHDALPEDRGTTGVILRSAAEGTDGDAVADDVAATWEAAAQVLADDGREAELLLDGPDAHEAAWRDWSDVDSVSEDWDDAADLVEALRGPEVALSGAMLFIEPTRALIAVDVNTADASPAAGLRANLAAARELPRQLRLRGLGGQIVLDLAPMAKGERKGWEAAMRGALRGDPVETSLIGWTPLGHYELTRKRARRPLELP